MAEYSYNYGGGPKRKRSQTDWVYWAVALVALFAFTPIGVLMIVLKLAGGKKRSRHPYNVQQERQGGHPYYVRQEQQSPMGARTVRMDGEGRGEPPVNTLLSGLSAKAKRMTVLGAVLSAVFGFVSLNAAASSLWILPDVAWYLEEVVPILCFFGGGLGCLWAGLRRQKRVSAFRSCLAMVGGKKTVSVAALASAMGVSSAKVGNILEDMLDEGFFPTGYLDYGGGRLVLDGAVAEPAAKPEPPKEEAKEPEDPQNAVLEEIRSINAGIDNPKLNQQIDRIGAITAKVFEYQRSHPQKSVQLHSFLSYYLPTTLKILRAYAQLEDQEVEGENITAAMERIENMMDKVVEGFEKQLDQLFQGDALDITADVEVLERMLAKDGLSSNGTLRMGG